VWTSYKVVGSSVYIQQLVSMSAPDWHRRQPIGRANVECTLALSDSAEGAIGFYQKTAIKLPGQNYYLYICLELVTWRLWNSE